MTGLGVVRAAPPPPTDGTQPCINNPEMWFPEKGESTREAKDWCRRCPFIRPCLAYALTNEAGRYGVWGGTSERERRAIRIRHGLVVVSRAGNALTDAADAPTDQTHEHPVHADEEAS